MTVAERLGPVAHTIATSQAGRKLRRELPIIRSDAEEAVEQVVEAIAKAAEDLSKGAERAGDEARKETRHTAREIGDAVGEAFGTVAGAAGDAATKVGDAARDLHLEDRVEDVVKRLRSEFPTERITNLVTNIERELPTTDKDRYDRAYLRGWTRARTAFVAVGLVTGIAAGIAGAFLLDPDRGPKRRAALKANASRLGTNVSRQARGRATWTVDRARGLAIERGLLQPAAADPIDAGFGGVTAPAPLVPVMDPGISGDTAPVATPDEAGGDATDPATRELADELAQMTDDGAPISTNPAS